MKLREILPQTPAVVEFRHTDSNGEDELFGFCGWDGKAFQSLDENYSYNLDQDILKYERDIHDNLTCWIDKHMTPSDFTLLTKLLKRLMKDAPCKGGVCLGHLNCEFGENGCYGESCAIQDVLDALYSVKET